MTDGLYPKMRALYVPTSGMWDSADYNHVINGGVRTLSADVQNTRTWLTDENTLNIMDEYHFDQIKNET